MFAVSTSYDSGVARVAVAGEVDLASVVPLRRELHLAAGSDSVAVEVDLRNVDLVDSVGVGILLGAARRTRERGGRFTLVRCPDHVVELLEICGVAGHLIQAPTRVVGS